MCRDIIMLGELSISFWDPHAHKVMYISYLISCLQCLAPESSQLVQGGHGRKFFKLIHHYMLPLPPLNNLPLPKHG